MMINQGQGLHSHFIKDLYVVCLYKAQISGECLQDHWSSGLVILVDFQGISQFVLLLPYHLHVKLLSIKILSFLKFKHETDVFHFQPQEKL